MQVSGYSGDDRLPKLLGRRDECAVLDGIVAALRGGESRALVLRGEPGIGKTALLNHLASNAGPCRVERTTGIQSEMEFAFAGIHQLCMPLLDRLDGLPAPQHAALSTALGMAEGPAPDRFLVGLAVLNLFSNVAADRPLLCLIDDEQWLDRASAQILAFVARRLGSESVGMVFAARQPTQAVAGLPTLVIRGLRGPDAKALLDSALTVPVDPRIRQQIIAETHGNPLALLELPRGLNPDELAGGFGLPGGVHLPAEMEQTFGSRIRALPDATRRLLLLAAAEPTGDSALIWRAAGDVGVASEEAAPAIEAGLASFGGRVKFRHPLVRSAAYRSASLSERQQAHRALATATDPGSDPDRRAWHLAHAVTGPDETVAAELEASAGRAHARGGISATAAFLERAAILSVDSAKRSERALAAASAKVQLGAFDSAQDLLTMAEAQRPSDLQQARGDLIRAHIAYISNHGRDSPPLLLSAAKRLESIDVTLSRVTYLDAMLAAMFAGRLAVNANVFDVALAAQTAPRPAGTPDRRDHLLDWLVLHYRQGYVAARPALGAVLTAFDDGLSPDEQLICALLSSSAAHLAWDDDRFDLATRRHVDVARHRGAIGDIPVALSSRATALLFFGDLAGAAAVIDELEAAQDATGSSLAPYAALGLAALRGDRAQAMALIEATVAEVTARGEGNGLTVAWWAEAVLHNGSGDYRRALGAAELAAQFPPELASANWALPELVEAAARGGASEKAADAFTRLEELTAASGTDWALGLGARSAALLHQGADAERLYLESIERFGRTRVRGDLARAHLLYGEWLRRERRRADAREHLRIAHTMFVSMTMSAFAERTQRELRAVGDTAMHERTPFDADRGLTAQESQVARLARDGLSNAEIGARLFISARTVQYHLSKVFAKLEVSSRSQLDRALPPGDQT